MKGRKRQKKIDFLSSKILFVLVLVFAFFIISATLKMYSKSKEAKEYLRATEEEYSALEEQYGLVRESLDYLKSETGIEREIRSKFDLAREGEKAVLILEEELPEIVEPEKKSFWGKIKSWVSF